MELTADREPILPPLSYLDSEGRNGEVRTVYLRQVGRCWGALTVGGGTNRALLMNICVSRCKLGEHERLVP